MEKSFKGRTWQSGPGGSPRHKSVHLQAPGCTWQGGKLVPRILHPEPEISSGRIHPWIPVPFQPVLSTLVAKSSDAGP